MWGKSACQNLSKALVTSSATAWVTPGQLNAQAFVSDETCKKTPESSRSEFLKQFSGNNLNLLDAEDNTSRSSNRGGIADLSLLERLLSIHQKSVEPNFSKVMFY